MLDYTWNAFICDYPFFHHICLIREVTICMGTRCTKYWMPRIIFKLVNPIRWKKEYPDTDNPFSDSIYNTSTSQDKYTFTLICKGRLSSECALEKETQGIPFMSCCKKVKGLSSMMNFQRRWWARRDRSLTCSWYFSYI